MMGTYGNRYMLVCTALALMILSVGAMASTGDRQNEQQYDNQMQQRPQYEGQTQRQPTQGMQNRNPQLERQVARQLRQQGFGEDSQILVLATGNRLILLGSVPDQDTKQQIEQTARQAAQGIQLDNRLVVSEDTERRSGEQLQQSIQQEIRSIQPEMAQNIQVQASNGRVLLRGQVDSWMDLADAIEAAFSAGAQEVTSQLQVTGADQFAMRQDQYGQQQQMDQQQQGAYPPLGYTPGQEDQMQQRTGTRRATTSDLILAHRIALEIQQQLNLQRSIQVADPQAIYIMAHQGTVTLYGSVQDRSQIQRIQQIVQDIRGVQNVRSELNVAGQDREDQTFGYVPGQDSQQTSRQQEMGQQQNRQGQQMMGQQQSRQQMSASDRRLAQQVEQQLQQQLPDTDINVSASQGTVTLQGSVRQQNQKQQAEKIAKSVSGVRDIRNNISVGEDQFPALGYTPGQNGRMQQQISSADLILSHRVALELQQQLPGDQNVFVVDPQAIYVVASQGTVMLYGSVQDRNQIQQIERIARNVQGVQNVQNQLNVAGQSVTGQQTGQQRMSASDRRLAQQVEQQLQQQLPDANINVMASQGTVILQGSVRQQKQKQQAEQIAKSVSGVRNIQNNITVGAAGAEYPPLGFVPGQEDQAQQETGISGDQRCIQMLKQSLSEQDLGDAVQDVYVTCHNGEMALYGYVRGEDEKDQLERATKQIEGIDEVDNNIVVREEGWEQKSDAEIKEDVESQLWWSPFVDSDDIEVSVQNGTVTLSGQVDDWDAEKAAIKNAFDGGARRVRSQLQVRSDQEDSMRTSEQDRDRVGQPRDDESGTD